MRSAWLAVASTVLGCGGGAGGAPAPAPRGTLETGGDPSLPTATNGTEGAPEDAPLVATKGGVVQVDGADVARVAPPAKARRVDALVQLLRGRADAWKKDHAGAAFPGRAAFSFEQDAPCSTVKMILASAASAGYPHAGLLARLHVRDTLVRGWLDVDTGAPPHEDPPERELRVKVAERGAVVFKWVEGSKPIGAPVAGEALAAKLAPLIDRSWSEVGRHRDANDARFDHAVVEVEDEAPYGLLVATVDALRAPKRQVKVAGTEPTVSAIRVTIPSE
jgi:hypothetical protein